jgi:predicted CoA-binding protein
MPITDDDGLRELLDSETIAVIGCSSTPGKAAHEIPKYLDEQGYEVIPVNPFADEIFGREPYDSLAEVEEDIDLVDVFRPSMEVPTIVEQVIARSISRQDVQAIWLQQGISHDEAAERAEDQGLKIVQDRCMKVEHERLR